MQSPSKTVSNLVVISTILPLLLRGVALVAVSVLAGCGQTDSNTSIPVSTVPTACSHSTTPPQSDESVIVDPAVAENWPGFMGPMGRSIAMGRTAPSTINVSNEASIVWSMALGKYGYSSPIIWKNRVFVSQSDSSADELICVDLGSGNQLWAVSVGPYASTRVDNRALFSEEMAASPTPVTDGKHVYVMFGSGDIACLDFSGREVWGRNLGTQVIDYGYASSPILCDNKLIVQLELEEGSFLVALNPQTGEALWKSKRPDSSWATPVLYQYKGRKELLCASVSGLSAHSLVDGSQLWLIDGCLSGEVGSSAAWDEDMVYVSSFAEGVQAFRLGDVPQFVWRWDDGPTEMASPLAVGGNVYIASQVGAVFCLDGKTGLVKWRVEATDQFYATPVCVDGKVYVVSRDGVMIAMNAGDAPGDISAHFAADIVETIPAFVGDKVVVRGCDKLICYGK